MPSIIRTAAAGSALLAAAVGTSAQAHSGNPGVWTEWIEARSDHVFEAVFYGGAPAYVWLLGDGASDLDLYVYDENDRLICSSESYDDHESCSWVPRWTGKFSIRIVNLGRVFNVAEIGTN